MSNNRDADIDRWAGIDSNEVASHLSYNEAKIRSVRGKQDNIVSRDGDATIRALDLPSAALQPTSGAANKVIVALQHKSRTLRKTEITW